MHMHKEKGLQKKFSCQAFHLSLSFSWDWVSFSFGVGMGVLSRDWIYHFLVWHLDLRIQRGSPSISLSLWRIKLKGTAQSGFWSALADLIACYTDVFYCSQEIFLFIPVSFTHRDGSMPVSFIQKYLMRKLDLTSEDEVSKFSPKFYKRWLQLIIVLLNLSKFGRVLDFVTCMLGKW